MRRQVVAALLALITLPGTDARGQGDAAMLGAIVERLESMQSDHPDTKGLWIREGEFDLSRHDVRHSFRTPLREWSAEEKNDLVVTAAELGLPLRFCREECGERPHSNWTVAIGVARTLSDEEAVVPVQVDASDENMSWKVVYEMVLQRSDAGSWGVGAALPGASSDAVRCEEAIGRACLVLQSNPDTLPVSAEDDDYAGEVVGALIGGVVSWYGLSILAGVGASWVAIIPGALIGMGIGSKF
jgi:hypothetical protein